MSENHTFTTFFEGKCFSLSEFSCACGEHHKTEEEAAPGYEIVFPQKGYFERRNSLGFTQADPTQVLFFNKDEPYKINHPLGGGDSCAVFTISASILNELTENVDQPDFFSFRQNHRPIGSKAGLVQNQLFHYGKNLSPENTLGFEEAVLRFLATILKEKDDKRATKERHKPRTVEARKALVEKVIIYMNKNFSKNFPISRLAEEVFSSPFHLSRLFQEETGQTLHGFRTSLRLRNALHVLKEKKTSITELALDLGFSSHSHFSTRFKKEFSISPKSFRGSSFL